MGSEMCIRDRPGGVVDEVSTSWVGEKYYEIRIKKAKNLKKNSMAQNWLIKVLCRKYRHDQVPKLRRPDLVQGMASSVLSERDMWARIGRKGNGE